MLKLNIVINGNRPEELEMGLAEVVKLVEQQYLSGYGTREDDTGNYKFDITGEEE